MEIIKNVGHFWGKCHFSRSLWLEQLTVIWHRTNILLRFADMHLTARWKGFNHTRMLAVSVACDSAGMDSRGLISELIHMTFCTHTHAHHIVLDAFRIISETNRIQHDFLKRKTKIYRKLFFGQSSWRCMQDMLYVLYYFRNTMSSVKCINERVRERGKLHTRHRWALLLLSLMCRPGAACRTKNSNTNIAVKR